MRASGEQLSDDEQEVRDERTIRDLNEERLARVRTIIPPRPEVLADTDDTTSLISELDDGTDGKLPRYSLAHSLGIGLVMALLFVAAGILIVMLAQKRFFDDLSPDVGWNDPVAAFTLSAVGTPGNGTSATAATHFFIDWRTGRVRVDFRGNLETYHTWMAENCTHYKLDVFNNGGQICSTWIDPECGSLQTSIVSSMHVEWNVDLELMIERVTWSNTNVILIREAVYDRPLQIQVRMADNTTQLYDVVDYQVLDPENAQSVIDNMFNAVVFQCTQSNAAVEPPVPSRWLQTAIVSHCPASSIDPLLKFASGVRNWQACTFPLAPSQPSNVSVEVEETGLQEICVLLAKDRHRRMFEGQVPIGSCWLRNALREVPQALFNVSEQMCTSIECTRMIPVMRLFLECFPCDVLLRHDILLPTFPFGTVFIPQSVVDARWNFVAFEHNWLLHEVAQLDTVSNASNCFGV
jgi:hypothetical protein